MSCESLQCVTDILCKRCKNHNEFFYLTCNKRIATTTRDIIGSSGKSPHLAMQARTVTMRPGSKYEF